MNRIHDRYEAPNFYITGDFNLGFLQDWNNDLIQEFRDSVIRREGQIIGEEKFQAQALINICDKWNLIQSVTVPTRDNNILDLILVNSEVMIKDIEMIVNSKLSDHNLIVTRVNMTDVNKEEAMKKNFCDTAIPEYNLDEASDEEWECALDWLLNKDLETVDES